MSKRSAVLGFVCLIVAGPLSSAVVSAPFMTLVDDGTHGFYNDLLGTILDRTNPYDGTYLFPGADLIDGDPTIYGSPAPDLSIASGILGDWLDNPPVLNINWSGLQAIPASWSVNTETAVLYEIDAGALGMSNVIAGIGVDNGVFVWFDGTYQFGALAPGFASVDEYMVPLGSIAPGVHYLQILREDHGTVDDFTIHVRGNVIPAPGAVILGSIGLSFSGWLMRRRRML